VSGQKGRCGSFNHVIRRTVSVSHGKQVAVAGVTGFFKLSIWNIPFRGDMQKLPFYGGIDRPARSLSGGLVPPAGAIRLHRHRTAAPEPCLKAVAPSRAGLVGAAEGRFPGEGLADLWAHEGSPWVLGHALSMHASQGARPHTTRARPTRLPPCGAGLGGHRQMSIRRRGAPPATSCGVVRL
jgi:hypothetical protein